MSDPEPRETSPMSADPAPASAKRFPASVYGVGEDPDPRFSLANERTFLAWIRTTLALLAAAAAVDALDLPMPAVAQHTIAIALGLAGLLSAAQAWRGWSATERAMRRGAPMPRNRAMALLVAILVLVAVAFLAASLTS